MWQFLNIAIISLTFSRRRWEYVLSTLQYRQDENASTFSVWVEVSICDFQGQIKKGMQFLPFSLKHLNVEHSPQ
jgi:hypothetical protein